MKRLSNKWLLTLPLILLAACTISPPGSLSSTSAPVVTDATQFIENAGLSESGWWNDAIFYEIFVRSFKDSDGDGIGDLNGLTAMLDYLNDGDPQTNTDLGITAIWLMPITESPSYHGYDVIDYYSLDPEYGTRQDFDHLIDEAHQRGIRVIIDLVINHTGRDHPWFQASNAGDPLYRDWYIWEENNPAYPGPWGQQVWYVGQDGYYYAVFWSGMPDLNLENPLVTQEMNKIVTFWLTEMDVDGFRLDAIRHFVEDGSVQENTSETHAWLQSFHQHYKSIDPQAFTVGEAWTETSQVLDYIGDEVDIAFEFDLAEAFVRSSVGPIAGSASSQLQLVLDTYPPGQYGVFLTNHDQDRIMSVLDGDVQRAKLAAVMLLTSPGIPFIYYGEEIGMTGTKPDEDIRRPMQWSGDDRRAGFTTGSPWCMVASDYSEVNVAIQDDDPNSLLNLYRELIHLRNAHPALRTGETLVLDAGTQRLYAVLRYDQNEAFLILVNVHSRDLDPSLYALSAEFWPVPMDYRVNTVMGQLDPDEPVGNGSGGITDWQPFDRIPSASFTILHFTP